MTPQQKIKWAIVAAASRFNKTDPPAYPCGNVDDLYALLVENDEHWDAMEEVRCSGIETGLPSEYCRHFESESVGLQLPDDSWVGWTYWYGGGKHSEPDQVEWIGDAYNLACDEEKRVITVRTFQKNSG